MTPLATSSPPVDNTTPDVSVIKLSAVKTDNARLRLDAGFFSRRAIEVHATIEALPHVRLGSLCEIFRKGIFDIKADSYVETGVPFVRIGNLSDGLLDERGMARITRYAHEAAANTALEFGDFVLSKTAYASAALITVPECNVSQDIIAARLSLSGSREFRSGFLVAYLTSRFGKALMARQFQGNVQEHLSLDDGKALLVPALGRALQDAVHEIMMAAHEARSAAAVALANADREVEDAIGLDSWRPSSALAYARRLSRGAAVERLDAEYYQPAKEEYLTRLAALPGRPLGSHYSEVRRIFNPARAAPGYVVRNFDLADALAPVMDDDKEPVDAEGIGSIKKYFDPGDVVTSRLRAYLRETALVRTSGQIPTVGSTEFLVLRREADSVLSQPALLAFLRSRPVQTILRWSQDGSHHPRYDSEDLLVIPTPDAVCAASQAISVHIDSAVATRARALTLLQAARSAVEVAIEDSEAAGLAELC